MTNRGSPLRRVVGNSLWLIGAEVGTRAVSFVTILYLSRRLAVGGMGVVEFGMAVFGVVQALSVGGVDILMMRAVARRPTHAARLAGTGVLVAWTQLLVVLAVVAVAALLLPHPPEMRAAAVLFGLAAALVPAGVRSSLIASERASVIGVSAPLGQSVFLVLCVLGVRGPEDVLRVPLFWIAAIAVRCGIQLAAFLREHGGLYLRARRRVLGHWLRAALRVGAGSVARGLMLVVDVLVLGLLVAPEQIAPYGLANKLPLFLASLAGLVSTALFPTIARTVRAGDDRRLAAIQGDALKALLGVALPGALCLSLVAEPLVVLLFTEKFSASAPLFRVLVWRFPLSAANAIFRATVWARDPHEDARVAVRVLVVALAAIVAGTALAGPAGAAAGILVGETTSLALYAARGASHRTLVGDGWLSRLAIAGAVLALLEMLARRAAGFPAVVAALTAWLAASLVADHPYVRRVWAEMRTTGEPTPLAEE